MRTWIVSTLILASLTVLGCGENEESLAANIEFDSSSTSWVTVRPIIANYCSKCHATFMDESEAMRSANRIVDIIEENPMHGIGALDVMNKTERTMLLEWAKGVKK